MDKAHLLQEPVLQIPLDGVKLYHGVGDRGAGGKITPRPPVNSSRYCVFINRSLDFWASVWAMPPTFRILSPKQVLKIMALINKEPVHAELLKRDGVILAALVVELGQPCLQGFPGALHLLDRVAFRLLRLGLLNAEQNLPRSGAPKWPAGALRSWGFSSNCECPMMMAS